MTPSLTARLQFKTVSDTFTVTRSRRLVSSARQQPLMPTFIMVATGHYLKVPLLALSPHFPTNMLEIWKSARSFPGLSRKAHSRQTLVDLTRGLRHKILRRNNPSFGKLSKCVQRLPLQCATHLSGLNLFAVPFSWTLFQMSTRAAIRFGCAPL